MKTTRDIVIILFLIILSYGIMSGIDKAQKADILSERNLELNIENEYLKMKIDTLYQEIFSLYDEIDSLYSFIDKNK